MPEVRKPLETKVEVSEQKFELQNYYKIKPEGQITFQESKEFWDKLFSSEIPDNERVIRNGSLEDSLKDGETDRQDKKGGSYADVFKEGEGDKYEVHHMPADSASSFERNDGPAIKMEKTDHRQTASWGNSKEAREYRAVQQEKIEQGRFREALQMDIDDIHEKFGTKYDDAIDEMLEYVDKLKLEGKLDGKLDCKTVD